MKKLTPFQIKMARWCGRHRFTQWAWSVVFMILMIFPLVCVALTRTNDKTWLTILFIVDAMAMGLSVILDESIRSHYKQLPETQVAKAKEFTEANPKYAQCIDELIREAYAQDDGGELREALEKFKILAGKEKYLSNLPNQAEKLKTEIAALEKELGMG